MDTVSKDAIELIDNIKDMDPNSRLDKLKNLTNILTETLKRGEEKVALAKSTFDAVSLFIFVSLYQCIKYAL
jgi:inhibitor of growth protein 5/inhibitor of growth protein 4